MYFIETAVFFFLLLAVYVVVPGSAGTDKVLTVHHSVAQSFPITVTGGEALRVTIAGNVKGKILQQTQLVSADISLSFLCTIFHQLRHW